jgi:hypothetical protein
MDIDLKIPPVTKYSDDELWKFVLRQTERDVNIVWGVHSFGPLTVKQVRRMYFPDLNPSDGSQISRRLALLRKSGDICVLKRSGDRRHFLVPGPAFIRELAQHEGGSPGWLWRRMLKDAVRSIASEHSIFMTDILSHLKSAEARGAGELLDWMREPRWEFRFKGQRWLLIPDIMGWWHSDRTGRETEFLLEADTGTETLGVVTDKIHRYVRLLQRCGFARDRTGRPGFPAVLLVARSSRRAESLSACVPAAVQKSGIFPDDARRFLTFAVTSLPLIEKLGIASAVWDVPLDRSGGRRTLDELLPPDHLQGDFRLRCRMLDPGWSKMDPALSRKQPK